LPDNPERTNIAFRAGAGGLAKTQPSDAVKERDEGVAYQPSQAALNIITVRL
jgi:hypothetical protein